VVSLEIKDSKENARTLFTAGSRLFVVLGRIRMKRERFDAGGVWNSSGVILKKHTRRQQL